jgi:DNA-binding Lrp family transcriptional regulator
MFQKSQSLAVLSRPDSWPTRDSITCSTFPVAADLPRVDRQLLDLLSGHGVLTTSQIVRLTGLPNRTVQHRLSRLNRAGLLNRFRPQVPVGTAPYHCWLTSFGARAIGAAPLESWDQNPADIRAVAALSELWLGVRNRGPEAGLHLESWRRLPSGVPWHDPRTETMRELPVEAKLEVTVDGELITALVLARVEQVPPARLVAILGRFAGYVATLPASNPALLVLVRTECLASVVRSACGQVAGAPFARHIPSSILKAAIRRVAIGVIEPRPAGLITEAVWHMAGDHHACRLAEALAAIAAGGR